jgi:hypothetical protein
MRALIRRVNRVFCNPHGDAYRQARLLEVLPDQTAASKILFESEIIVLLQSDICSRFYSDWRATPS